jgi:hypothetical protein
MYIGPTTSPYSRTSSTASSSARSRAAEDLSLQNLGKFLYDMRTVLDRTQKSIDGASHSWHRRAIDLAATHTLQLNATASAATLRSSGAIGGAPNSFTPTDPTWNAASRSQVTIGGAYDGSNGDQTLTLRATQGGVIGEDELVFAVLDQNGDTLEQLTVAGSYAAGEDITLANGLTMQLGSGLVGVGAEFTVAVAYASTDPSSSFDPAAPSWSLTPRPASTFGGAYDGSNGTQQLTFRVSSGGTVGVDNLVIDVLDQNGDQLEQLSVDGAYTPGDAITLANGVTLGLAAGYLGNGDTFAMDVSSTPGATERTFTPGTPAWSSGSTTEATIGGAYDGSNGSQTLTFRVATAGEVGTDALVIEVLDANGDPLQQIDIAADYVAGDAITLNNGLTISLGAGTALEGDTFTVDVSETTGPAQNAFTPVGSDWTPAARSAATIGGAYDGTWGSQQLTLRATAGGIAGSSDLQFDVLDANGEVLTQFTVAAGYTPGDEIALGGGLTLALGAGAVGVGDAFTLDVAFNAGGVQSSATPDTTGWNTGSSPTATIGGQYDGSNGSQDLTLRVAQGGDIGSGEVLIDVLDANGDVLEQLTVAADYSPGAEIALANGLTLSLTAGQATVGDTFGVTVGTSASVDADAAFDGSPAWLQEATIADGSFEINGVAIDVYATDSLNAVLERINAADAGVTASFNAATSRIVLTSTTAGGDGDIQVANDTSGFLAATQLDDATLQAGAASDFAASMDQVSVLSDIGSGTISVNGTAIAIDVSADSLNDIRARLSAIGVTLDYDADGERFTLHGSGSVTLDDGDTGFFAALGIEAGEHEDQTLGFGAPDDITKALGEFKRTWNEQFAGSFDGTAATQSARLNSMLRASVQRYFTDAGIAASDDVLRTDFGLTLRFRLDGGLEVAIDEDTLAGAMRKDSQRIQDFLVGQGEKAGLLDLFDASVRSTNAGVSAVLGVRGLSIVNTYA